MIHPVSRLLPFIAGFSLLASACDDSTTPQEPSSGGPADKPAPTTQEPVKAPDPVQEPLEGGPFPSLILGQAWFWKDAAGKPKPGPARMQIWRQTDEGWVATRVEDPESNVFHKAIPYGDGILTIGAEQALLKKWTFENGAWKADVLWSRSWGGKFDRLRDIEIGDVDHDGKDEFVIATHDNGVIAVLQADDPDAEAIELDPKPDTFVHEIEIGDLDGDGKNAFFATPSGRNKAGASQEGGVVMYRWDGEAYQRTVVEEQHDTHAKEILATDLDGDGADELLGVMEAKLDVAEKIVTPVQIKLYEQQEDGTFTDTVIASIQDRQTRFLVPGDFDEDGTPELVAAAMKSGVWVLDRGDNPVKGTWETTNIDAKSSGFEHVAYAADLDEDGKIELYVAADDQQELKRYVYDPETDTYHREVLGKLPDDTFTWNMEAADL